VESINRCPKHPLGSQSGNMGNIDFKKIKLLNLKKKLELIID
jgi:hypothetical protein